MASALRLDPRHRGALEYSGERYLITDNLPKAEQRLAALDKANGNKYVAALGGRRRWPCGRQ